MIIALTDSRLLFQTEEWGGPPRSRRFSGQATSSSVLLIPLRARLISMSVRQLHADSHAAALLLLPEGNSISCGPSGPRESEHSQVHSRLTLSQTTHLPPLYALRLRSCRKTMPQPCLYVTLSLHVCSLTIIKQPIYLHGTVPPLHLVWVSVLT